MVLANYKKIYLNKLKQFNWNKINIIRYLEI